MSAERILLLIHVAGATAVLWYTLDKKPVNRVATSRMLVIPCYLLYFLNLFMAGWFWAQSADYFQVGMHLIAALLWRHLRHLNQVQGRG